MFSELRSCEHDTLASFFEDGDEKKLLYLLRTSRLPRSCSYFVLLWGGKISLCPCPYPIFDLVHIMHVAHLIVSVQMSSGLPKQLLPGNFCHRSIIFTACAHMLILICIAQTIHMIIFYSNPQGKCGGQFFPSNSVCSPFWKDLLQLISSFADFSGNF